MARAETIETVGEGGGGGGGNGLLPSHNTCHLPRPLYGRHSVLITPTGPGLPYLQQNHHLDPLQVIYPLPYTHAGSRDHPSPASSPAGSRRAVAPRDPSGGQPDPDREDLRGAPSPGGPLPDLLPQNERSPRASGRGGGRGEAAQEMELRRVARRLKLIGDEFNAAVLHRAHGAPHWRDWRDACRGLLNFVTQALSALYRLT
ncbi:uncharacterized protein LOC133441508 [Cololabis saira]|uniref:uncharacterized protein LOC133441508 n=1 Tax=Cololabis saira TaxID=129043 RepID=UPI002AD370E7|nr:uncharacterized protein LOC133441508 [Cololabis saira]